MGPGKCLLMLIIDSNLEYIFRIRLENPWISLLLCSAEGKKEQWIEKCSQLNTGNKNIFYKNKIQKEELKFKIASRNTV